MFQDAGAYPLVMGIISGYPTGAKILTNFRNNNICSKEECERLLSFTNNSGPLFILGTVGISLFGNSTIGLLLFITHILSCLTVGILFRFWKYNQENKKNLSYIQKNHQIKNTFKSKIERNISFSDLGTILGNAISSSISTIVMIGGFIVLFSVILSIIKNSNILLVVYNSFRPIFNLLKINYNYFNGFISGLIELTNGINQISIIPIKSISINIIICSILLGFGGISVLLQVLSIISKTDISIKPYIIGKILHGIISGIYTYIFINYFPIFNFNL